MNNIGYNYNKRDEERRKAILSTFNNTSKTLEVIIKGNFYDDKIKMNIPTKIHTRYD